MDNIASSPIDSLPSGNQSPQISYRRDRRRGSIFMRKNLSDAIVGGLSDNGLQPQSLNLLNAQINSRNRSSRSKLVKHKHSVLSNQIQSSSNVLSSSPGTFGLQPFSEQISKSGSSVQLNQNYPKNLFCSSGLLKRCQRETAKT